MSRCVVPFGARIDRGHCSISQPLRAGTGVAMRNATHPRGLPFRHEHATVAEVAEGIGLRHEVQRREPARIEPLAKDATEYRMMLRRRRRPFARRHSLVPGAVELRTE